MKRFVFVTLFALTGCQAAAVGRLEAQVRALRAEQERHAAQIERLQNRVELTAHAARSAQGISESVDAHRETVSLGVESQPPEPIRVDSVTHPAEATPAETAPRPEIRIGRNDRIPERAPFVVHPVERLSVVPVAPMPETNGAPRDGNRPERNSPNRDSLPTSGSERRSGPESLVTPTGPSRNGRTLSPGFSTGVLDPAASGAYDSALALVRGGRCGEATTAFREFLNQWPAHPHADNALYWQGECLERMGNTAAAITAWETLIERFSTGNKVPDALFKLARARRRAGDVARAERHERQLLEGFPESDAARRLRNERQ